MSKPFLKWAGGKAQLLEEILSRRPQSYSRFVEPMVGGGAVLFGLNPESALISDSNRELIITYREVKSNPDLVLEELAQIPQNEESYYQLRGSDKNGDVDSWSHAKRAARTIFLNKLGYNGLYRVNSAGHFNVPFGKRTGINFDRQVILDCANILSRCDIREGDFSSLEEDILPGDWIYLDPPYLPISETSNFTQYTNSGFTWADHLRLKVFCDNVNARGAKFLLSNCSARSILELYSGYNISVVFANRSINSKAAGRGRVPEILVSNY